MEASRFYRYARLLFLALAKPMFRFRVDHAERVPERGPGVVVAPHRSWLDPACVAGACRRPIRFLILEAIHGKRWARWFYRGMRTIPIAPEVALAALRCALAHLEAGGLVGVFPEGRVVAPGRVGVVHPGAALLAIRSSAPVIPVAIEGSAAAWPHGRLWPEPAAIRVRVGEPILPPERVTRRTREELVRRIESVLLGGAGP